MNLSKKFVFEKLIDGVSYRTNFKSENDVQKWLDEYSRETNTNWIIRNGLYNPQR